MKLKIALLQIPRGKALEENLKIGIDAVKKAKAMGADIALFPEMYSNGYDIYDRPVEIKISPRQELSWRGLSLLIKGNRFGFACCERIRTGVGHRKVHFCGLGRAEITVRARILHLVKGISEHLIVRFLAV